MSTPLTEYDRGRADQRAEDQVEIDRLQQELTRSSYTYLDAVARTGCHGATTTIRIAR